MKKTLRISFNGKTYEVVAELLGEEHVPVRAPATGPIVAAAPSPVAAAPAPAHAAAPAPAPAPAASGTTGMNGVVPSPLAGRIVTIHTPVGAAVKSGQPVVTLEAMKMNTIVAAHADGTVSAVHVNPGDAVEEGQPLLSLH